MAVRSELGPMSQCSSDVRAETNHWTLSSLVLGAGFSLTGAGTILLGILLPLLEQKWGLRDDQAGLLLFLQFLGSSLGAILTSSHRVRSLITGYGLLVVSAGTLAFAGLQMLFAVFFFFGLGLGMTMTATSLLFSDRYDQDRAIQLERLNFAWSAGAGAAPVLFLPFLRGAHLRPLFFLFQGLFLLLFCWVFFRERRTASHTAEPIKSRPRGSSSLNSMLPLVLLAIGAVGVETALSGWLTTYSHRVHPAGAGQGVLATSFFMFGIVASRLVFSTRLLTILGRRRLLGMALWGTAVAVALLIAGHDILAIDFAAGMCGLSIGPLYPLLLSFLLERSPRGWIFGVAGIGSAVFPWLTGLLSAHYGSLRYGLAVPCTAALLMILLSPAASSRARAAARADEAVPQTLRP
jgi:MFS transporter, FHS family, glucose/mannose:H+ symporter